MSTEALAVSIALYDENGVLIGCKKDAGKGSFSAKLTAGKSYTVKAFLCENMTPIDLKTERFVCGDMSAYLFVHFSGSEKNADDEQIYFSVSKNGKDWITLNDKKTCIEKYSRRTRGLRSVHNAFGRRQKILYDRNRSVDL